MDVSRLCSLPSEVAAAAQEASTAARRSRTADTAGCGSGPAFPLRILPRMVCNLFDNSASAASIQLATRCWPLSQCRDSHFHRRKMTQGNGVMNKARKSIVVAMLGVSMLTCLSGCMTTGCNATHPFSTMFQGYDPIALNSNSAVPEVVGQTQQTAAADSLLDQTQF